MSWIATLLPPKRSGGGGSVADTISGFAYPGETLTATGGYGSRDWQVDGVSTGSTGATYTPTIYDIGKPIKCVTGGLDSNVLTCWHPSDIAAVKSCRVPWLGVLNSVSPDVAATVGQTVRRWNDIVNAWAMDQTTGANQPVLRQDANGMYYVEGDGAGDRVSASGAELATTNGAAVTVGLIVAGRDRARTTGDAYHPFYLLSTNNALAHRLSVNGRWNSKNQFTAAGRRLNTSEFTAQGVASDGGHHVLSTKMNTTNRTLQGFVDGVAMGAAQTLVDASGAISATNSAEVSLFGGGTSGTNGVAGDIYCAIHFAGNISAANESQLLRFAMLCMGANYAGPDIPLV